MLPVGLVGTPCQGPVEIPVVLRAPWLQQPELPQVSEAGIFIWRGFGCLREK